MTEQHETVHVSERDVLDFDGRVLEIFNNDAGRRMLAAELSYQRTDPDKKGRVTVMFKSLGGSTGFVVEPDSVAAVDNLLAKLDAAGVKREA